MGAIANAFAAAFPLYKIPGVPASGPAPAVKELSFALGGVIETALAAITNGQTVATVRYATLALMQADTGQSNDTLGYVYDDPVPSNNGLYFYTTSNTTWTFSPDAGYALAVQALDGIGGETVRATKAEQAELARATNAEESEVAARGAAVSNLVAAVAVLQQQLQSLGNQAGGAWVGAGTLSALYALDTANAYRDGTVALVFQDGSAANNGTWTKTGAGNGSGNWTQQAAWTLLGLVQDINVSLRTTPVIKICFMFTDLPTSGVTVGDRYIVAWPGATNVTTPAWGQIAHATTTSGGWVYITPVDGDEIFHQGGQCRLHWYGAAQVWSTPPASAATATLQEYDPAALATGNKVFADCCSQVRAQFALGRYRLDGGPSSVGSVAALARSSSAAFWSRDEFGAGDFQVSGTTTRSNPTKGQACERAATNYQPNSTMAGAAPGTLGSGGALPTGWGNWAAGSPAVVVNSINTVGAGGGYQVLDATITRGSFTGNQLFLGLGPFGSGAPTLTLARGGAVGSAAIRIEQNTGITYARLYLEEFTSGGSTVGTTYEPYNYFTNAALVKRSIWRAITSGNKGFLGITVQLPDTSSAFTFQFALAMTQLEDGADDQDYTSWIPTSSGSVTRNAETVTLDVPAWTSGGSFDIFLQGENYGFWSLAQTPGSNQFALAALSYQSGLVDAVAMPAGSMSTWDMQNAFAESLYPTVFAVPTPGAFGGVMLQQADQDPAGPAAWYRNPLIPLGDNGNGNSGHGYAIYSPADAAFTTGISAYAFQAATNKRSIQRFEARSGDVSWFDTLNSTPGVEHLVLNSEALYARGTDVWFSFAYMLEPGAPISISSTAYAQFLAMLVFHDNGASTLGGNSDPFQLNLLTGDFFSVDLRYDTNTSINRVYTSPAPITRGAWHRVVLHVRTDSSSGGTNNTDGRAEVWHDGTKVVDYSGALGYSDVPQNFPLYGLYRRQAPETTALRFANYEESTSSLAARVAAPLPIC